MQQYETVVKYGLRKSNPRRLLSPIFNSGEEHVVSGPWLVFLKDGIKLILAPPSSEREAYEDKIKF